MQYKRSQARCDLTGVKKVLLTKSISSDATLRFSYLNLPNFTNFAIYGVKLKMYSVIAAHKTCKLSG